MDVVVPGSGGIPSLSVHRNALDSDLTPWHDLICFHLCHIYWKPTPLDRLL